MKHSHRHHHYHERYPLSLALFLCIVRQPEELSPRLKSDLILVDFAVCLCVPRIMYSSPYKSL